MIQISTDYLSLRRIAEVSSGRTKISLSSEVCALIDAGASHAAALARSDQVAYGINTGFGSLCRHPIGKADLRSLQRNHLLSHACGIGPPVEQSIVRLMIALKLLSLRSGHSGVTVQTVMRLLDFLNEDILPEVPSQGSVGASGDLAPLAHLSLPLIGEGRLTYGGASRPAAEVLRERGWARLELQPKEGLALTNGIQFLNAFAVDAILRAERLLACGQLVCAMSMQGFSVADSFFHPLLKSTTAHPERWQVLDNFAALLAGGNHASLPQCDPAREDPYSFRCVPQVFAATLQTLGFCAKVIERDCNTVSDNPLLFPHDGKYLTNGSMHGQSTALAMDFLAIALTDFMSMAERRVYQLLSGRRGLPDFLAANPGPDSGLMVWQYTAAALVNESKILATPASIDTIMTCQLQEDHVSMGGTSVLKIGKILSNLETILAIELLTAAAAIDCNRALRLSPATAPVHNALRRQIAPIRGDRLMGDDLEKARQFLTSDPVVEDTFCQLALLTFGDEPAPPVARADGTSENV